MNFEPWMMRISLKIAKTMYIAGEKNSVYIYTNVMLPWHCPFFSFGEKLETI